MSITSDPKFFYNTLEDTDYEYFKNIILNELELNELIDNAGVSSQFMNSNAEHIPEEIKPELGDLGRLMHLIRKFKSTSILEFGSGKSTLCSAYMLLKNREIYSNQISKLRVHEPWKMYSIETNHDWLENTKNQLKKPLHDIVHFHHSTVEMGTFQDKICTYYKTLPQCRPDLIYLDGPDQYAPENDIQGISTNHPDRMPLVADILRIEYLLEPGCIIVVDGRTSNARFLKNNLQMSWHYEFIPKYDQHFFLLNEAPLGSFNREALSFHFS